MDDVKKKDRLDCVTAVLLTAIFSCIGTAVAMRFTADTDHVLLTIKDHRIAILKDTADTQDKTIKVYKEILSRLEDSGCSFRDAEGL
jgi:hypothetical protein